MTERRHNRLATWARLLRLPNLFTVPGDPVAGYLLVAGARWSPAAAGAAVGMTLVYEGGLLLNDVCDRQADAVSRPDRPLPAGEVQPRTVLAVGAALMAAGVLTVFVTAPPRAGVAAAGVAVLAAAYDRVLKHHRVAGALAMGLCRAGSVLTDRKSVV